MLSSFKAVIKSYEHFHFSTLESKSATIWRCAGDFFQGFAEIQNGRHRSTSVFLWTQKLKKLKSEIIQISQSHSPRYGDVQVIFLGFNRNSKWPPWINIIIFIVVAKPQKLKGGGPGVVVSTAAFYAKVRFPAVSKKQKCFIPIHV